MERFSAGAVPNGTKPHHGVGGSGIISEHLTRILKQYEMSAMNSLRGPAMSLQNSFRPPNMAALQEQQLQYAQQQAQHNSALKQVAAADKPSLVVRSSAPPQSADDLLGMLAAMSHALKPPMVAPFTTTGVLASRDRGAERRCETLLEGEWISCFEVGGEKRLCLPQILAMVLRDFDLQLVNDACTDLHIHCSQCTQQQLDALKMSAIIPMNTAHCGLMTKTDAERLTNYLLQSRREAARASKTKCQQPTTATTTKSLQKATVVVVPARHDPRSRSPSTCSSASTSTAASPTSSVSTVPASPTPRGDEPNGDVDDDATKEATVDKRRDAAAGKIDDAKPADKVDADDDDLPVYHECFGRCRGIFKRRLYANSASECVQCAECSTLLPPYRFVLHSHRHHETRTCHWGFDSANWRAYLHVGGVASDEKRQRLERLLDEAKAKFAYAGAGQKRSMSLDAKSETFPSGPTHEKRPRLSDFDASAFGAAGVFTPPSPLLLYDQLLIYPALLAAQKLGLAPPLPGTMGGGGFTSASTALLAPFAALAPTLAANWGAVPKFLPSVAHYARAPSTATTKSLTSSMGAVADASAVEEAAAALLKLAPQIAAVGGLNAQPVLESFKSKFASVVSKDFASNDAGHSSCIEPLKKHILHRTMSKPTGYFSGNETPVMARNGAHSQTNPQVAAAVHCDMGKMATSEDTLDLLLERYVLDRDGLRLIRAKLADARRQADGRLDSLTSQNRILQREIAYLRNKQVGGALCSSSVTSAAVL